jgi:hypothetical protein
LLLQVLGATLVLIDLIADVVHVRLRGVDVLVVDVVLRRLLPQVLLTATQSGVSPRAVKVAVAVIATGFI